MSSLFFLFFYTQNFFGVGLRAGLVVGVGGRGEIFLLSCKKMCESAESATERVKTLIVKHLNHHHLVAQTVAQTVSHFWGFGSGLSHFLVGKESLPTHEQA